MSDNYVKLTYKIIAYTDKSIAFNVGELPDGGHRVVWIPKSLIHGGDLLKLERAGGNELVSFRVMEWKAQELGI